MAQAALGGVVVRRRRRFAHKYEELLDVALDAPAQLGLGCRAVIQEGTADGEQALFPGLLCGAPLLFLGMGEGFGLSVEPVDGFGPLGQLLIGVRSWMSRSRWAQHRCLGRPVEIADQPPEPVARTTCRGHAAGSSGRWAC